MTGTSAPEAEGPGPGPEGRRAQHPGGDLEGPRAPRASELSAVIGLSNAVFSPDGRIDMGASFPSLFAERNRDNLRIVLSAGEPVSLAGFTLRDVLLVGAAVRTACIGSVCTREDYRGLGIASRLMEDAVSRARKMGASLILVSGARGLYRRISCVKAGLYRILSVSDRSRLPELSCTVREWEEKDVAAMAALQRAERARFRRETGEMRMLLRARSLHSRPARTWVVHEGGKLRAYLCAAAPDPRRRGGVWEVLESGGSRPAVLACLPAILRACATSLIEVETTIRDAEMEGLARDYRIPVRARGFRGTLKIIDTPRFLRSIQGYVRQGLPSRDRVRLETSASGGVRLAVGAEELLLRTDREAAAFFFGSLETPPSVSARGRLRQAVDRLFPLPLPVYGLNYI